MTHASLRIKPKVHERFTKLKTYQETSDELLTKLMDFYEKNTKKGSKIAK